jgi:isopropylmalate/homocitrate/citramalate synthase
VLYSLTFIRFPHQFLREESIALPESSEFALGRENVQNSSTELTFLKRVKILDSTLREGEQSVGVSFTKRQRLQIAWMLDYFGVDAIEISPIVSDSHRESLREMIKAGLAAQIVSHGRALIDDVDISRSCDAEWIAMYHSVSDIHLASKLHVSRETALERSISVIDYAKSHGLKVRFTAEDATRSEPDYLSSFISEVTKAGVDRIGIPDTVGISRPQQMARLIKLVRGFTDLPIDVHCHNDLGLALANSLAAAEAGAEQIHVTIDGLGERVGITSLAELTMSLRLLYNCDRPFRYEMLSELSELVSNYTGTPVPATKPIVGRNAYTHKAGTHVAAIIRNPEAYEIIPPRLVGNTRRLVFGELSGKNGAAYLLRILGVEPTSELSKEIARGLKNLQCGDLFALTLDNRLENRVVGLDSMTSSNVALASSASSNSRT